MYTYESALHNDAAARSELQVSMLISCYEAAKGFLDHFMQYRLGCLAQLTIVQLSQLMNTLILMVRLSRPLTSVKGWDATAVRSIGKVETYIDALYRGVSDASLPPSLGAAIPETLFLWLRLLSDGMKKWLRAGGVTLESPYMMTNRRHSDRDGAPNNEDSAVSATPDIFKNALNVDGLMEDMILSDGFWGNFAWDWPSSHGATTDDVLNP